MLLKKTILKEHSNFLFLQNFWTGKKIKKLTFSSYLKLFEYSKMPKYYY